MGLVDLGKHALIILDDHEAYNGVSELEPLSTDRTCPAAVSMRRLTPRAGVVRFNRRLRLDNARCGRAADDGITVLRPMVLVDYPSRCSALVCFVRGYSFAITLFGHCIIAILQPKEVVTLDSTRFSLLFAGPPTAWETTWSSVRAYVCKIGSGAVPCQAEAISLPADWAEVPLASGVPRASRLWLS